MATKKGNVTVRGTFVPGTKVKLFERGSEITFSAGVAGDSVKSATTSKNGETEFKDVPLGTYWAVGEVETQRPSPNAGTAGMVDVEETRTVAVTVKDRQRADGREPLRRRETKLTSAAPGRDTSHDVVTGARGSESAGPTRITDPETGASSTFAHNSVGVPSDDVPDEPQPHLRQEDVDDGIVQRSATLTGQATPKDPDELQPRPSQEDLREGRIPGIPKDAVQRSATPFGEATPKAADEVQPAVKQEDVAKGTLQRSDTPSGQAEPKPSGDAVENQLAKDNSTVAALGATVPKAGTDKVPNGAKKGAKKRAGAKKASAKKATKAATKSAKKSSPRKRAAKKGR
jgi:hypothetical protein